MSGVDILKVAERHAPEVVYLALRDAIEENQRLADTLRETLGVAEWMSGSADFSPEGVAHEGWLKAQPVLGLARAALDRHTTTPEDFGDLDPGDVKPPQRLTGEVPDRHTKAEA